LKQVITIEQLEELTLQQKDILRKWWNPEIHTFFVVNNTIYPCEDGKCFGKDEVANGGRIFKKNKCLPLLNVGQMIEILSSCNIDIMSNYYNEYEWAIIFYKEEHYIFRNIELCNALWEGVKLVLSNKL